VTDADVSKGNIPDKFFIQIRKRCGKFVMVIHNKRPLATGPPTPRFHCKFKYWNYSVL